MSDVHSVISAIDDFRNKCFIENKEPTLFISRYEKQLLEELARSFRIYPLERAEDMVFSGVKINSYDY